MEFTVGTHLALKTGTGRGRPRRVEVVQNKGIFIVVRDKAGVEMTVQRKALREHTNTKRKPIPRAVQKAAKEAQMAMLQQAIEMVQGV